MNSPSRYHSMIGVGDPSAEHCKVTGSWRATVTSEGCSVIRGGLPTTATITNKTNWIIRILRRIKKNWIGIWIEWKWNLYQQIAAYKFYRLNRKESRKGEGVSLSIGDLDCADTYLLSFSLSLRWVRLPSQIFRRGRRTQKGRNCHLPTGQTWWTHTHTE